MSASTKAERLKQKQEQDAVLGRVSLALARSQRLIDSWLPASGDQDSDDEEQENDQGWGGLPDGVGLGGQVKSDGLANGHGGQGGNSSELDRLRKQLLGKKALGKAGLTSNASKTGFNASKPMGNPLADRSADAARQTRDNGSSRKRADNDEDDDEDDGRSAAFKSKKRKVDTNSKIHPAVLALQNGSGFGSAPSQDDDPHDVQDKAATPTKSESKRGMTYLDQVLAERSEKKKKKKKKKKTKASDQHEHMTEG